MIITIIIITIFITTFSYSKTCSGSPLLEKKVQLAAREARR